MLFCWSLKKDCEIIAEPERQKLIEGGIACDGDCWNCDESEFREECCDIRIQLSYRLYGEKE